MVDLVADLPWEIKESCAWIDRETDWFARSKPETTDSFGHCKVPTPVVALL
jgi:hypothetical protein